MMPSRSTTATKTSPPSRSASRWGTSSALGGLGTAWFPPAATGMHHRSAFRHPRFSDGGRGPADGALLRGSPGLKQDPGAPAALAATSRALGDRRRSVAHDRVHAKTNVRGWSVNCRASSRLPEGHTVALRCGLCRARQEPAAGMASDGFWFSHRHGGIRDRR